MEKVSPVFSRTYDFIVWLLGETENFPKSERFRMARRLEDTAFDLYDQLARAAHSVEPLFELKQADHLLVMLRLYLRLSYDRHLLKIGPYEHGAQMLVEVGRLLGGWMKKVGPAPKVEQDLCTQEGA